MTDSAPQRQATIVPHPAGHKGVLKTTTGDELPVQSYQQSDEEVVLVVLTDTEPETHGAVDVATLEYATVRGIVRLHGAARFEPSSLVRFHAEGDAEVIQRRAFVRVHTPQEVRLVADPAGDAVRVYTIDLSGGGMLLSSAPGLRTGDTVDFEIAISEDEPMIEGIAVVVRVQDDGRRALAFDRIDEGDRQRLIHFVFSLLRESRAKTRGDHL